MGIDEDKDLAVLYVDPAKLSTEVSDILWKNQTICVLCLLQNTCRIIEFTYNR